MLAKVYIMHKKRIVRLKKLPFYEIQGLCENMVETAIKDPKYKEIYETKYVNNVTKFSKELEFCLHELNMILYDPFNTGKDEVLLSNGNKKFKIAFSLIYQDGFNNKLISDDQPGIPLLEDKVLHMSREANKLYEIKMGLIDKECYMDAKELNSLELLAQLYLMNELIKNKELFEDYMTNKGNYTNTLEYVVKGPLKLVAVKRDKNKDIRLTTSDNPEGAQIEFINAISDLKALENTMTAINIK